MPDIRAAGRRIPSRESPKRGRLTILTGCLLFTLSVALAACNGSGSCGNCFAAPIEFADGVVAADLNGDQRADVIALSTVVPISAPNSSNLKTYLSTGPGAFAAPTLTTAGTNPLYIAAADLNGDGLPDVVTASFDDGTLSVFLNRKTNPASFAAPLVLSSPGASQVAIGDVNGDGLPDLVSADFSVSLFVQTSPGAFAAPIGLYAGGANWVAVGDLNDDGAPDIALTDAAGVKVLMHMGPATGAAFAAPVSVFQQTPNANVTGANLIAIGDVNGDGLNDLVITDPGPTGGNAPTVNVLLQDPANHGSFLAPIAYPIAANDLPASIVLADLEGTGLLDIVIGGGQTVTVLLHDPAKAGGFLPATVYPAQGANEIAIADVNGDGRPDIVTSNGITQPTVNGVVTTNPGMLLQSATTPGTFGTLQDLP